MQCLAQKTSPKYCDVTNSVRNIAQIRHAPFVQYNYLPTRVRSDIIYMPESYMANVRQITEHKNYVRSVI